jgi:hypothetical protein
MIQGSESGSVPKCHGSGTLHQTKTAFFYYILTKKIQNSPGATRIMIYLWDNKILEAFLREKRGALDTLGYEDPGQEVRSETFFR